MVNRFDRVLPVLVAVVIAAVVAVMVVTIVWGMATRDASGSVLERKFTPAYTTTQCTRTGEVTTCTPRNYPDSWELRVEQPGWDAWVDVSESEFDRCKVGDYWDSSRREGCGA